MKLAIYLFLSYLCGAIPFAYIIAKTFRNIDIRKCGSCNPGATNVFRSVSKSLGVLTFLFDALKGFVPVYFAVAVNPSIYFILSVALVTLLGHIFTVFLNFKGGKGVATGCGVFLAFAPGVTCICFIIFILILFLTKYVALSSISASMMLPVCLKIFGYPEIITAFACLVAILVTVRHAGNIKRIIKGTESKIFIKMPPIKIRG